MHVTCFALTVSVHTMITEQHCACFNVLSQGRNAEADELETLMNASDASSDGGNDDDSDIVDCEDLE